MRVRAHQNRVRTGNAPQGLIVDPRHPRHRRAIAEAQHQFGVHFHAAAFADHQTHEMRAVAARRHEIDQRHRAIGGLEPRLQDQRVGAIAAGGRLDLALRRDQPATILVCAQQRGKAGVGVESRPAQPIDRAVAADQSGRAQITDQCIVFYSRGHGKFFCWNMIFCENRCPLFGIKRYCVKSSTVLTSLSRVSKASCQRASGTRRVIRRASQSLSAFASASAAAA